MDLIGGLNRFQSCVGGAIVFLELYLTVDIVSLCWLFFCPFVIAGTFVQLTFISVISAISHLSRCHLRAISQSSRCHLRAISQSSKSYQSYLAVISAISQSSRCHLGAISKPLQPPFIKVISLSSHINLTKIKSFLE